MTRYLLISLLCAFSFSSLAMPNLRFPTLGGVQCWDDIQIQSNWHLQRNCFTGHYRVLNPKKIRFACGGKTHCSTKFQHLAPKENQHKKVFLLIHGLGRSHHSMNKLAKKLHQHGHTAYCMEYSSLLSPIEDHSERLKLITENFKQQDLFIITHSFGGIILRHNSINDSQSVNCKAAVLIAAPNQGSTVVDTLSKLHLNKLLGPSGQRLGSSGSNSLTKDLPAPPCPFITIAGTKPSNISNLPFGFLYSEPSDGIVKEVNTRHPKSEAHFIQTVSHTFIMNSDKTLQQILDYCCP